MQWLDIINVPELYEISLDYLRKRFFVCTRHFRKEDYKNRESRSLNTTAYPRLFLRTDDANESEQMIETINCQAVDDLIQTLDSDCTEEILGDVESPTTRNLTIRPVKKLKPVHFIQRSKATCLLTIQTRNSAELKTTKTPIDLQSMKTYVGVQTEKPENNRRIFCDISDANAEPPAKKLLLEPIVTNADNSKIATQKKGIFEELMYFNLFILIC